MSQHQIALLRNFYGQILVWMQEGMPVSFEWSELMGLDGFKEVLMGWRDTFDEYHVEPREFIDIGPNKVIVVVNDFGTEKSHALEAVGPLE